MNTTINTGTPIKYHNIQERVAAFKQAVGLRQKWEECTRLGLTYEQMTERGVKPLRCI